MAKIKVTNPKRLTRRKRSKPPGLGKLRTHGNITVDKSVTRLYGIKNRTRRIA